MEEHESGDGEMTEKAEQASELSFEDIEEMVDEALALPPAVEFKIPVSPFFIAFAEGPKK